MTFFAIFSLSFFFCNIYVYTYACTYICKCIYALVYISTYICKCICAYIHAHIHTSISSFYVIVIKLFCTLFFFKPNNLSSWSLYYSRMGLSSFNITAAEYSIKVYSGNPVIMHIDFSQYFLITNTVMMNNFCVSQFVLLPVYFWESA